MTDAAPKRTPWFPWGIWPVHVGWYEMKGYMLDVGTPMFWNGNAEVIVEAMSLLKMEASATKMSCQVGKAEWACEGCDPRTCMAKTHFERLNRVADGLKGLLP